MPPLRPPHFSTEDHPNREMSGAEMEGRAELRGIIESVATKVNAVLPFENDGPLRVVRSAIALYPDPEQPVHGDMIMAWLERTVGKGAKDRVDLYTRWIMSHPNGWEDQDGWSVPGNPAYQGTLDRLGMFAGVYGFDLRDLGGGVDSSEPEVDIEEYVSYMHQVEDTVDLIVGAPTSPYSRLIQEHVMTRLFENSWHPAEQVQPVA